MKKIFSDSKINFVDFYDIKKKSIITPTQAKVKQSFMSMLYLQLK